MKFSAVILLLQIIAHSVGLPECTCVETFNSVEECVAGCLLEERVSICGHLDLPLGLSWH